ncbi:hypothetical protein HX870_10355 [Pseudomonas gingeri]|uniref:Uncharacterized protein n=1 Tax=Pseudomonas gingeri TaxID=117681 RepID=A0A7Y7X8A4_9PSED|nr:hypothetical protein [Pseudomonas gingeri]NWB94901.1 hypothetical protein [Pseudomonas gingeri]NWD67997.1 hypothetical protein [Pseudomonas gingeri]
MSFNELLFGELLAGEKAICFFVNHGRCYWVLDYKYNFSLDAEKDYRGYLEKGHITREQYALACREFRGGILRLTSDNFPQYMAGEGRDVFECEELEDFFDMGVSGEIASLLGRVEEYYLSGAELNSEDFSFAGVVASRLPMFYVNFDRKIYKHLDFGRSHEELVYSDWVAKYSDFNFLIPDRERYWARGGDYWKLRFIQTPC